MDARNDLTQCGYADGTEPTSQAESQTHYTHEQDMQLVGQDRAAASHVKVATPAPVSRALHL